MSLNCQADELTEQAEGEEQEEAQQTCGRPNVNSSEREVGGGKEVGRERERQRRPDHVHICISEMTHGNF